MKQGIIRLGQTKIRVIRYKLKIADIDQYHDVSLKQNGADLHMDEIENERPTTPREAGRRSRNRATRRE
jgi:hypothetical protein